MHRILSRALITVLVGSFFTVASTASAEPSEKTSAVLTRTATPADLKASLSKNIYKQVPYQSEYEVQIPYEAEETYTDYEDQSSSEYVCHDRTEYQNECHYENRCEYVPGQQYCHYDNVCQEVGGGRTCHQECGNGERGYVCHDVCEATPGSQQCHQEQRCETGPSSQQCHQEQVCGSVPVTRQECGYETVHRSVPVQRTRTVTRYRSETRCCETRYRTEFDYQASLNVTVLVPAEAVLENAEKETFKVAMTASNKVELTQTSTLYGYKVASQQVSGSEVVIKLELAPKYTAAELGDKTISGTSMAISSKGSSVSFSDAGLRAKVRTNYQVLIIEKATSHVLETSDVIASAGQAKMTVALKGAYSGDVEYLVRLQIQRDGLPLGQTLQFVKDFTRSKDPMKVELFDGRVVAIPKISGTGKAARVVFKDGSPETSEVTTSYTIKIVVPGGFLNLGKKTLVEKTVSLASVSRSKAQIVDIALSKLGADAELLQSSMASGKKVSIDVTVKRQGARLNGGKALTFTRSFSGNM